MVSKSFVIAGFLLAGTSLMAQDFFAGVDYGDYKSTITATAVVGGSTSSEKDSDRDKNFGIKLGIDNFFNGRTYISYSNRYNDTDDGFTVKYKSIVLNYDYYIGKYNKFTPFVGVSLGQGDFSWNIDGLGGASDTGVEYGAKLGALVEVNTNANLEIGYLYNKSNIDATYTASGDSIKIEADKIEGFYFGVNMKF